MLSKENKTLRQVLLIRYYHVVILVLILIDKNLVHLSNQQKHWRKKLRKNNELKNDSNTPLALSKKL